MLFPVSSSTLSLLIGGRRRRQCLFALAPRLSIFSFSRARTTAVSNANKSKINSSTRTSTRSSTSTTGTSTSNVHYTPILIVGGGPCGLLLSRLLDTYKTPCIVLEALPATSRQQHPQAHFFNTRTMEILKHALPAQPNRVDDNDKQHASRQNLYQAVTQAMPPVDEYKMFRFGYDMTNDDAGVMAQVRHPVDRPIEAHPVDANGTLVACSDLNGAASTTPSGSSTGSMENSANTAHGAKAQPLSVCNVGHLAQHTFCQLLYPYDEANANEQPLLEFATVHFDSAVVEAEYEPNNGNSNNDDDKDGLYRVTTASGAAFVTPILVAADGFHSTIRKQCKPRNLDVMDGQAAIQHLINVHVRVVATREDGNTAMLKTPFSLPPPPAMLYSIWNPNLVGMMVRHSQDEYVLQIPYFPPYQTVEGNFTFDKVMAMVEAAFGVTTSTATSTTNGNDDIVDDDVHSHHFTIESIRPWTMSSLIARRYYVTNDDDDNNGSTADDSSSGGGDGMVLVGDAAHVFPPAGGFGMNTGLQDVHNLAWRLALWHKHSSKSKSSNKRKNDEQQSKQYPLSSVLARYEAERRPIAQRNAALSVRNYRRILELSKACYLNEQHPTMLIRLLDQMTFLPLSARQTMFQNLLEAAMLPLSALKNPAHPHTRRITANVRGILKKGGGLPLLFPKFELGFGYEVNGSSIHEDDDANGGTKDSMGYTPQVREGYLLPHVALKVLNYCPERHLYLQNIASDGGCTDDSSAVDHFFITSSDLPAQLSPHDPCFVALLLNVTKATSELVLSALETIRVDGYPTNIASVVVLPSSIDSSSTTRATHTRANMVSTAVSTVDLIVQEGTGDDTPPKLSSMLSTSSEEEDPVLILIRPDGHVCSVLASLARDKQDASEVASRITHAIDEAIGFAHVPG